MTFYPIQLTGKLYLPLSIDSSGGTEQPTIIFQNGKYIEVDKDQLWYWSDEWQKGEQEVNQLIKEGKIEKYNSLQELFDSL